MKIVWNWWVWKYECFENIIWIKYSLYSLRPWCGQPYILWCAWSVCVFLCLLCQPCLDPCKLWLVTLKQWEGVLNCTRRIYKLKQQTRETHSCRNIVCYCFSACTSLASGLRLWGVLIASSGPLGCRSRCCRHSLLLSFVEQMQLSWQPSGASWPPAAVFLSSPVIGLWPEGGVGVGPWVAFLALAGAAVSPSGRVWLGVGGWGRTL